MKKRNKAKKISRRHFLKLFGPVVLGGLLSAGGAGVGIEYTAPSRIIQKLNKEYLNRAKKGVKESVSTSVEKGLEDSFLGVYNQLRGGHSTTYQHSLDSSREALNKYIEDGFKRKRFSYKIIEKPKFFSRHNIEGYRFSLDYDNDPIAYFRIKKEKDDYRYIPEGEDENNLFTDETRKIIERIIKEEFHKSVKRRILNPFKKLFGRKKNLEDIVKKKYVFFGILGLIISFLFASLSMTGFVISNKFVFESKIISAILFIFSILLLGLSKNKHTKN